MKLSILCVTRGDARAIPFLKHHEELALRCMAELIVAVDDDPILVMAALRYQWTRIVRVRSLGFIESVLDRAVMECQGEYVLRLDDDETLSADLATWIVSGRWQDAMNWQFRRAWLWPDERHCIGSAPHWPDWQTRLSVRQMAGGRTHAHAGSPYGPGSMCVIGAIKHHKLLFWSMPERRALVDWYNKVAPGSLAALERFYLPSVESTIVEWPA